VKLRPLLARFDFDVALRPVYPLAVRTPDFFKKANPKFAAYVVRDSWRIAQMDGIAFRFPRPDPIAQNMATLEIAPEQPRIRRITRLAAKAQEDGRSLGFVNAIAPVLWDGSTDDWHDGDHLARAAAKAGFDLPAMEDAIAQDVARYEAIIAENEAAHAASGHWGVPTFVFEGEPFFGQDRLDVLIWRMKQKGLRERP
jgi:2-hydroxychromene-2-carboxylate isomerase